MFACLALFVGQQMQWEQQRPSAPRSASSVLFLRRANPRAALASLSVAPPPPFHPNQSLLPERKKVGER